MASGYIVTENQENGKSVIAIQTVYSEADFEDPKAEAEAKYHTILAAAAKSKVECHSANMQDSHGSYIKSEEYHHPVVDTNE